MNENKQNNSIKIEIPQKAEQILNTLHQAGYEAYVVGGCVRDSILGRIPGDWDITTDARPQEVKKLFRRTIDTGIAHGTVTIMLGSDGYEVTTYRIDGEYADSRHPKDVTFTASLREDLRRRDFTINAMAYNQEEGLIDAFDGIKDIHRKVIRCVGDPMERFGEDALRIMRAIRFSAQLDYSVEEQTQLAIRALAPTLSKISAERIQTELVKMLCSDHPGRIRDAYDMGITGIVLPEFDTCMKTPQNHPHHMYSVGEHIVVSMENVRADRVLRLTMLFHDIGKPMTISEDQDGIHHFYGHAVRSAGIAREIMLRLKFDRETMTRVCNLVRFHDLHIGQETTPADVRMAVFKVGEKDFPLLLEVKRADMLAQSMYQRDIKEAVLARVQTMYEDILEAGECLSLKQLAVRGQDLIAAGISPGKELGEVLQAMLMEVLQHPECNTREYLMEPSHLRKYGARVV
ncbi:MAG: CCA tRNA nucleotidyltransferase [Butyrivibrio sp.]|jgi:tRNA nucleotidyltransferase (CCA-adding enzyme)|nr:CCA tRNA nucleotidyltransferase [Butyrivibrio sp.]